MDNYGFDNYENNNSDTDNDFSKSDENINSENTADVNTDFIIVNDNPAVNGSTASSEDTAGSESTSSNSTSNAIMTSTGNGEDKGYEKTASFYTESYKKPKRERKNSLVQLILVAVMSSILGGGIVFAAFQFIAPAIQSPVGGYFSNFLTGKTTSTDDTQGSQTDKIVKIESTDSPVTAIAEKVGPSIVGIRVTATVASFFGQSEGTGEGSGIIIKSDGYIMTNNHVIENAMEGSTNSLSSGAKIEVVLPNQTDKPYTATVVGRDSRTDLAVLKIDATDLPAAELGDSDELKVGELAVAIGNPGGLEYMGSVTSGIISGLNRTVVTDDGKKLTLIQTDAAINPGNSGGALVNSKGQVIGINTIKVAATGYEGLGFAIPVNTAKEITDSLIEYKYVKGRPRLGVTIDQNFNESYAKMYNVPVGLLVYEVEPLSGAYKAGVKSNDIITKFDGQSVKVFDDLQTLISNHKPGDEVELELYRDGKTITLKVTLTEAMS